MGLGGWKFVLVKALYYIFPNLEKFDLRDFAIHQVPEPFTAFLFTLAYAAAYIVLLLAAATWVFEGKEI